MCMTYSVLSCKLTPRFSTFHAIFRYIEDQLEENILHYFFGYSS